MAARKPQTVAAAAKANDGLGVLVGLRLRLAEMIDVASDVNVNIVPQIAGRLQAVNREIDERLGLVEVAGAERPVKEEEPDDELARLRRRAGRAG